jgi:hypothetical protein
MDDESCRHLTGSAFKPCNFEELDEKCVPDAILTPYEKLFSF